MYPIIKDRDIREAYEEDTVGRKYHNSITSKNNNYGMKTEAGNCTTLQLNEPMTWTQFKKLSDSLKIMYLKHLREKYNVNISLLAKMFGVVPSTVFKLCQRLGFYELLTRTYMTKAEKQAWNEFVNSKQEVSVDNDTDTDVDTEVNTVVVLPPKMKQFTFETSFSGTTELVDLINHIGQFIPEDAVCDVQIHVARKD
jgi:predicted transcriptional regulator